MSFAHETRRLATVATVAPVVTLTAALLLGAGCAANRTIPPTSGSPVFDTSLPPGPEIIRLSIAAANERGSTRGQPIVFNLPPGVQKSTWSRTTEALGPGARPMRPGDGAVTSIERIRIDGGQAWVDVLVPQGGGYQLFTVHLRGGGFAGWQVTYVQPWMVEVDPPTSHSPWATSAS